MEVSEIRKKREQLEAAILGLVTGFEKEANISISDIRVYRASTKEDAKALRETRVRVRLRWD